MYVAILTQVLASNSSMLALLAQFGDLVALCHVFKRSLRPLLLFVFDICQDLALFLRVV